MPKDVLWEYVHNVMSSQLCIVHLMLYLCTLKPLKLHPCFDEDFQWQGCADWIKVVYVRELKREGGWRRRRRRGGRTYCVLTVCYCTVRLYNLVVEACGVFTVGTIVFLKTKRVM